MPQGMAAGVGISSVPPRTPASKSDLSVDPTMRFTTLVYKSLARRRVRSILTVCGIAVAIAAVVALRSIARNYEQSQRSALQSVGADLVIVRAGGVQHLSSVLEESLVERVRQLPEVQGAWPRLTEVLSFPDFDFHGVPVHGVPRGSPALNDLHVIDGRGIGPDDQRSVMLGEILARRLDRTAGQQLELLKSEPPYHVAGVFRSLDVFENGSVMMPIDELQALMLREGEVTQIAVACRQHDPQSVARLQSQIADLASGLESLPTAEFVDSALQVRMAKAVSWLTSTVALVIGTFGVVNTMSAAVFERTRELALLRALGWRKQTVFKLVLCESALVGLAGAAAGTVAAIMLILMLSALPPSGRLISGQVAPQAVLEGVVVASCVSLIGGIYPAYRAARLAPVDGLDHV
ncbi:ABC transporter permease [Pirellulales bacterium]|nr:ABC transporter permease [Pirellulales bacterium]